MRAPVFFQSKVERLERAGDLSGIIAVLADRSDKTYERAHAAKALADHADRLGTLSDQAVAVLMLVADEASEVRKWALFALAELREATALPAGSSPAGSVPGTVVWTGVSITVISVRNWEVTVLKKRSILPLPWGR